MLHHGIKPMLLLENISWMLFMSSTSRVDHSNVLASV
jgi:hypothetical protein